MAPVGHDLLPISAVIDAQFGHTPGRLEEMMTAQAGRKPGQEQFQERREERVHGRGRDLAGCYGAIGIASVAAAARYVGETKGTARAPSASQPDERFIEAAA